MVWHQWKKDINYDMRKTLIRKITQHAHKNFDINSPVIINPPVNFTHAGGKVDIISIERFRYMSQFKREFTIIRVHLSDGSNMYLNKLRLKHLLPISQLFSK